MKERKTHQVNVRLEEQHYQKLIRVQENIATEDTRKREPPELGQILRCIVFGINPALVSSVERAFLAGEIDDIVHGEFTPEKTQSRKVTKRA